MRSPTNRWRPVPGIRTGAPPTPLVLADELHLFVQTTQMQIAWSRYAPRVGWDEWRTVPCARPLAAGPTAVEFGGAVHLFARAADHRLYQTRLSDGEWAVWTPVPGAVPATSRPRAVVWGDRLLLVVRDESSHVLGQWYGDEWEGWSTLSVGQALVTPHPIVWGDLLHLFMTDPDHRLRLCSLPRGGQWSSPQLVPGAPQTLLSPWAIPHRSALVLGATGQNGQLCLARKQSLSGWTGWHRAAGAPLSQHGPALCALADRVYLFVTGPDGTVHYTATR
ncbi:MAG TPA: hypothetical protein VK191_12040 [Symbiobacteriaceae bacterium]|nr:hypothetical protein [Symbiobacteriaceae bacterium]